MTTPTRPPSGIRLHRPGALVANLATLVGFIFLGWSVWTAIAIYWVENVINIVFTARRLFGAVTGTADPLDVSELGGISVASLNHSPSGEHVPGPPPFGPPLAPSSSAPSTPAVNGGAVVGCIYAAVMGMFALVHGMFIGFLSFFGGGGIDFLAVLGAGIAITLARVFLPRVERPDLATELATGIKRMFVLQFTIIFGGWIVIGLFMAGDRIIAVSLAVLFVAVKTIVDLRGPKMPERRPTPAR